MRPHRNRARIGVEHLNARCLPSGVLGQLPTRMPAVMTRQLIRLDTAAPSNQVVQSRLTVQVSSDGSMALTVSGAAKRLGRFAGTGTFEKVDIDPQTKHISASGSATLHLRNGDRLNVSFTAGWSLKTRLGIESIKVTGGTGRFAGATGAATLLCRGTVDPNSPLAFECNSKGSLILILARRGSNGAEASS